MRELGNTPNPQPPQGQPGAGVLCRHIGAASEKIAGFRGNTPNPQWAQARPGVARPARAIGAASEASWREVKDVAERVGETLEPKGFARPRAVRAYARPRPERSLKGDSARSDSGGEFGTKFELEAYALWVGGRQSANKGGGEEGIRTLDTVSGILP